MADKRFVLVPCSGKESLDIPRGHLYLCVDRKSNELGWITEKTAIHLLPKATLLF